MEFWHEIWLPVIELEFNGTKFLAVDCIVEKEALKQN